MGTSSTPQASPSAQVGPPSSTSTLISDAMADRQRTLDELRMMFRYASGAGLQIDQDTALLVAIAIGEERDLSPTETQLLSGLVRQIPQPGQPGQPQLDLLVSDTNKMSLIIAAHNALAKLIAPATPISLAATEPAPGWLGSIRRPPLILAMIIIALIAILGLVITSVISPGSQKDSSGEKKAALENHQRMMMPVPVASFVALLDENALLLGAPPNAPPWQRQLNWLLAAALGAVFYVLFTAHEYVKNRTFDPRYNTLYVVRFVLGVVSGLILANVLSAIRFNGNETLRSLGPDVAALLGGFSTEAVYQVLQRLVEVMLAAIRGDNAGTAKAQAADTVRTELLSLAADPTLPPPTVAKLQAAVKKVGQ